MKQYMTVNETAEMLGINARTLHRWHSLRMGPPRIKVGRKVRYRPEAVAEWMLTYEG